MSLQTLTLLLHKHHNVAPIVIIDEYDTPIQQGHVNGFYDTVIGFMRNLFSGGLKDNPHLSYGFLTGILRVAKESIFSGLNNLKTNSILDERYSEYFGFTADEVHEINIRKSAIGMMVIASAIPRFLILGLSLDTSTTTAVPKHSGSLPAATTSFVRCWLLQRRILWSAWNC